MHVLLRTAAPASAETSSWRVRGDPDHACDGNAPSRVVCVPGTYMYAPSQRIFTCVTVPVVFTKSHNCQVCAQSIAWIFFFIQSSAALLLMRRAAVISRLVGRQPRHPHVVSHGYSGAAAERYPAAGRPIKRTVHAVTSAALCASDDEQSAAHLCAGKYRDDSPHHDGADDDDQDDGHDEKDSAGPSENEDVDAGATPVPSPRARATMACRSPVHSGADDWSLFTSCVQYCSRKTSATQRPI